MGSILEKIEQALKDMLIGWIESNLTNMFTDVNEKVGTIAAEVGQTPSGWNGGVYQMIRGLSENVIVPIAGIIITFVLCYELISMITEKNNLHDMDSRLKIADNSLIRFSAASSSFFLAAFLRLPPSSFCSISSFINRASCFAA